jgi:hypothetical protein
MSSSEVLPDFFAAVCLHSEVDSTAAAVSSTGVALFFSSSSGVEGRADVSAPRFPSFRVALLVPVGDLHVVDVLGFARGLLLAVAARAFVGRLAAESPVPSGARRFTLSSRRVPAAERFLSFPLPDAILFLLRRKTK